MKTNTMFCIVEPHNCPPWIYKVNSKRPINIDAVWDRLVELDGLEEDRDGITFVEHVTTIDLDKQP